MLHTCIIEMIDMKQKNPTVQFNWYNYIFTHSDMLLPAHEFLISIIGTVFNRKKSENRKTHIWIKNTLRCSHSILLNWMVQLRKQTADIIKKKKKEKSSSGVQNASFLQKFCHYKVCIYGALLTSTLRTRAHFQIKFNHVKMNTL